MIIGTINSDAIQPPLEPFAVEGLFRMLFLPLKAFIATSNSSWKIIFSR